ncbi:hypothetical protein AAFO92_17370 [Roseovarius sp. CAU 1744]|uniref:hypothetical protein n=1 Tax=Roseovarius sp. CAU 1744 TaxID=3140368 RepID=UPI00325B36CF
MLKRVTSRVWHLTTSIPPIRPGNLLPVLVMVILWFGLRFWGVSEDKAFVIACVTAQAYVIWRNLPGAALSLQKVERGKPRMLVIPVSIIIAVAALQLWLGSPLFTQRVVTFFCLVFLIVMVWGIMREQEMLDRVVPEGRMPHQVSAPVSLLRINAIVAAVVIGVNELLIAFETLSVWISLMPVLVLALHAFYWLMVLSVLPTASENQTGA